jgi:predicted DNA-binding transcriptional regulator AlpA
MTTQDVLAEVGQIIESESGPTLEEIRRWPATVSPAQAASAFGISRGYAYELIKRSQFPARVLKVGGKPRVITASILAALSEGASGEDA